jgi:sarcosine oxidase gamma subunit
VSTSPFNILHLPERSILLLEIEDSHIDKIESWNQRFFGPSSPGQAALQGPRAYSLGSTEWLLIDCSREYLRRSIKGLSRTLLRVTDLTRSLASLRVAGSMTRTVLASGGDIKWIPWSEPGHYGPMRLGRVPAIVQCVGYDTFELFVIRNRSARLEEWLYARHKDHVPH